MWKLLPQTMVADVVKLVVFVGILPRRRLGRPVGAVPEDPADRAGELAISD